MQLPAPRWDLKILTHVAKMSSMRLNNTNLSYIVNNFSVGYDVNNVSSCLNNFSDDNKSCFLEALVLSPVEIIIIVFLSGFIGAIIIGNIFVILSVCLFRDMRTVTNGLIVSLASADLLVALIVLPLSLYHEVIGQWTLGSHVCDFWITSDVFCCTSSILNIVVIAVDRYWLITKHVKYTHSVTLPRRRACVLMSSAAWVAALVISSSPLLGWRKGNEKDDPTLCLISQDIWYTVFSTFGAFWCPLILIIIVYMQIFKIARKRALTRAKARAVHPSMNSTLLTEMPVKSTNDQAAYSRRSVSDSPPGSPGERPQYETSSTNATAASSRNRVLRRLRTMRSESRNARYRGRLRSSARTLGLIIGCFVLCWLPFFIMATVIPFCAQCIPPHIVGSVVLWLGYSNSLLNPAIYAIWDKNFRRSFKKLLTCDIRCSAIF